MTDGNLKTRLDRLGQRLDDLRAKEVERDAKARRGLGDTQGFARALRLSSEFVAGILVGGVLGFFLDRVLGTSPWLLIVLLMLGFAAGVMNVMRSAGLASQTDGSNDRRPGPPGENG